MSSGRSWAVVYYPAALRGSLAFRRAKRNMGKYSSPPRSVLALLLLLGRLFLFGLCTGKSRTCANRKKSMINRGLVFFGGVCQKITSLKVLLLFPSVLLTVMIGPSNLPMAALYLLAAG